MSKKISNLDKTNYPIRMGNVWQDDEVTQLITSVQNRKSISEIAKEHQRTQGGIRSKLSALATDYYMNDVIIEAIKRKENKPDPILAILKDIQERLETLEMRVDDISTRPIPLVKIIRIVKKKIVYGFID